MVFLVVAGVLAGVAGSVAGLASLVSYPALLAVGLPALAANVTNTVALVLYTVGAASFSRRELAGQAGRLRRRAAGRLARLDALRVTEMLCSRLSFWAC